MKKILILLIILMVGIMGVYSQQVDFADMEASFSDFSADVAQALPFASTIGLNWSDAKVRGFPHFGVGVTAGAVMIPEEAFTDLADSLGISLPSEITGDYGAPFPVYVVDARLGLPFLPFDIGAKLGALTPEMSESLGGDINADFTMAGFDLRFPILKGNLLLPAVSVSAGYNYLSGGVSTTISGAGDVTNGIDLTSLMGVAASIDYTDPDVRFAWETHAVDLKLQASKNLLIFTPYVGGSYTYGWSKAGGGVLADISFTGATEAEIKDALEAAGYDIELSGDGFTILSESNGGSLRAFAGVSVNLFILKLDINAMYNVLSQSLGGSANVRIAF